MSRPEARLEQFFTQNSADLVVVTQTWYPLTNYMEELFKRRGARGVARSHLTGKVAYPNPDFLPEKLIPPARHLIAQLRREPARLYQSDNPMEAIAIVSDILEQADTFSGRNQRGIKLVAYDVRGNLQGHWFDDRAKTEHGRNRLSSLALLSAITDYMRSDIESGYFTDLIRPVTVCFSELGMGRVQQLTARKIANSIRTVMGSDAPVIFGSQGKLLDSSTRPQDQELAELEDRLLTVLPSSEPEPETPAETLVKAMLQDN
ncbi:MAG: hypothetical protein AAB414_05100 [Patescibacteria group bacterium]